MSSGRHGVSVDLRLDVADLLGVGLEPRNVNFDVEVTNVADDSILLHGAEVLANNDVSASSGGDEDLSLRSGLVHCGDFVTGHGGLESVDGVNLGNDDSSTVRSEGLGALKVRYDESQVCIRPERKTMPLTPLPTSPYPATMATLPANMISVARLIPSTRDSLHP